MGALYYLKHGATIYRGFKKNNVTDQVSLELFARALKGRTKSQMLSALREGIPVNWDETYDIAIPYGDKRGVFYESVWIFDFDRDMLIRTLPDGSSIVPLDSACRRELSLEDFSPMRQAPPPEPSSRDFPAPYWELEVGDISREKLFLGRILQDFAYAWRHLLCHQQNHSTFLRLAAAVAWISALDFTVVERTGFDHSPGGPYAWATELPEWECPESNFIKAGGSWFVLSEDPYDGLDEIRRHHQRHISSDQPALEVANTTYALLSLRHVILVHGKHDGKLEWTRPEKLFGDQHPPSSRSIDLLLWGPKLQRRSITSLNLLPVELQDRILHFTTVSAVAAAKLGCELGLGSPFSWYDSARVIKLEHCKRKRTEWSVVESQIRFGSYMSAVSYKPEFKRDLKSTMIQGIKELN